MKQNIYIYYCKLCWVFTKWIDVSNITWILNSAQETKHYWYPSNLPALIPYQVTPTDPLMRTHCHDSDQQRSTSPVYITSVNGTVQYEQFCIWLLSFTITFLRFILIVECNVEGFNDMRFTYKKKIMFFHKTEFVQNKWLSFHFRLFFQW